MKRRTLVMAIQEAGLLGLAALLGHLLHQPFVFASLGPTAFEMVETPERPSAMPRNILAGHGIGIGSALLALFMTHAWAAPAVTLSGVPALRVGSIVLAGLFTVLATVSLDATQPAALSTTVLIASGIMQSGHAVLCICASVLLFAAISKLLYRSRIHRPVQPDPNVID